MGGDDDDNVAAGTGCEGSDDGTFLISDAATVADAAAGEDPVADDPGAALSVPSLFSDAAGDGTFLVSDAAAAAAGEDPVADDLDAALSVPSSFSDTAGDGTFLISDAAAAAAGEDPVADDPDVALPVPSLFSVVVVVAAAGQRSLSSLSIDSVADAVIVLYFAFSLLAVCLLNTAIVVVVEFVCVFHDVPFFR